jgi:hypothetical protein
MAVTRKLTGKTRHRIETRLFRQPLLILQVEVHDSGYRLDGWGGTDTVDEHYWRDATVEDMTYAQRAAQQSKGEKQP